LETIITGKAREIEELQSILRILRNRPKKSRVGLNGYYPSQHAADMEEYGETLEMCREWLNKPKATDAQIKGEILRRMQKIAESEPQTSPGGSRNI